MSALIDSAVGQEEGAGDRRGVPARAGWGWESGEGKKKTRSVSAAASGLD